MHFPSLPVSKYTIVADLKGFRMTRATGNVLVVSTPLTVDGVRPIDKQQVCCYSAFGESDKPARGDEGVSRCAD